MNNIEGKSAVVTGATRGIGLAIARALLHHGGRVFICARDGAEVEQAVASLKSEHRDSVRGLACNVRSYDSVRSFFSEIKQTFGTLDILVVKSLSIGGRNLGSEALKDAAIRKAIESLLLYDAGTRDLELLNKETSARDLLSLL